MRRILLVVPVLLLALPAMAFASSDAPPLPHSELLTSTQFWAAVLGSAVPIVAYIINFIGPHTSEKIKAVVFVIVGAAAGVLAQLLDAGTLAFDTNTLQVVATSVGFALLAHFGFWKPSGIAAAAGAGRNAQTSWNPPAA